jgi:hypothetical protein
MCTRVLSRPIVFLRFRCSIWVHCSILILLIRTVRCRIPHCTCGETGWKGVTGLIWLTKGTTVGFRTMREDTRLAEQLLAAEFRAPLRAVLQCPTPALGSTTVVCCAVRSRAVILFRCAVHCGVPEGLCPSSRCCVRGTVLCRRHSSANYIASLCWLSPSSPVTGSPLRQHVLFSAPFEYSDSISDKCKCLYGNTAGY